MHYASVENITKSFGIRTLFKNITFYIEEGDKIALEYGGMRFFPEHTIVNNLVNNVFKDTLKAVQVPYYTSTGTIYLRGNKIKGEPDLIKKTIKDAYSIIGENGTSVLTQTDTVPFDFFTQFIRDPEFNKIWTSKYKNNPPDLNNFAELDSDQKNKIIDILISDPIFRDIGAGDFIIRKLNEYVFVLPQFILFFTYNSSQFIV